jgi:hypothetical protein
VTNWAIVTLYGFAAFDVLAGLVVVGTLVL